jgi:serine/threonine protein kinase
MQHDDLIGQQIDRYTLTERLGAGGMASVYRAQDADQQTVALKILPVHLAANEKLHERFMREARMAARLTHRHILPVYDFGETRGTPYIVMKLVLGGTLDRLIKRGPLDFRLAVRVLAQVAQALDYAHSQGVIHRDLKPENILFDARGEAYLADFGIARIHEATERLTGSGGFIGTAAYASPEQCRGEELTSTSDIYSLGVVLYEMLTGTLPFNGPTPLAIIHQHISEPVPNPLSERPDLPMDVTDVIRKALAKLPAVRYQSAQALSVALNKAMRRELGTKPFAEYAPPRGPNPVFDKPSDAYQSPSIPDELLRDLSPTNAKPLPDRAARIAAAAPPDAPDDMIQALEPEERAAAVKPSETPGWVWLALVILALLVMVVLLLALQ